MSFLYRPLRPFLPEITILLELPNAYFQILELLDNDVRSDELEVVSRGGD